MTTTTTATTTTTGTPQVSTAPPPTATSSTTPVPSSSGNTGTTISYDQIRAPLAHISSIPVLETQLAKFAAELAATEEEPATPARLAAAINALAATCAPARYRQFACVIKAKSNARPVNACSVPATGNRQLLLMHCDGGTVPPVTRLGYVDCATVGPVVSVSDPVGDTVKAVPQLRGSRAVPIKAPWSDLTEVRVSVDAERLCIDFRTVAPPRGRESFTISAYRSIALADKQTDALAWESATLGGPVPVVGRDPEDPTTGQVGSSGNWTSLVMNATDFGSEHFPAKPFVFRAGVSSETKPRGRTGLLVADITRPAAIR